MDFELLQQQGGQITSILKVKYRPSTGNNFTFTTVFLFLPRVGYCKKEGTCVRNFQETLINTLLYNIHPMKKLILKTTLLGVEGSEVAASLPAGLGMYCTCEEDILVVIILEDNNDS